MSRSRFVSFFILILISCTHDLKPEPIPNLADDTARFLAGMEVRETSPLYPRTRTEAWQQHNRQMNANFAQFESVYGSAMRQWSLQALPDQPPVLFYPFGGPDQLMPQLLFGKSTEYILFGMEPAGDLANLAAVDEARLAETYLIVRRALSWFLTYTYFQTYQMDRWLRGNNAGGAASVILVFLARTESHITSVVPVRIDPYGKLLCLSKDVPDPDQCSPSGFTGGIPGVRIYFVKDGRARTVTYFTINANDESLQRQPNFLQYLRTRGDRATFMKAASYLLYGSSFNIVKNFVLRESKMILTDDAGLPHAAFDQGSMDLTYFGSYIEPMPLYWNLKQPELQRTFATRAQPLPFEIGYTASYKRGHSTLILARRRNR